MNLYDKLTSADFIRLNGKDIFICSYDFDFIYDIDIIQELFGEDVDDDLERYINTAQEPLTNTTCCYTLNCREKPIDGEIYCYYCLKKKKGYI